MQVGWYKFRAWCSQLSQLRRGTRPSRGRKRLSLPWRYTSPIGEASESAQAALEITGCCQAAAPRQVIRHDYHCVCTSSPHTRARPSTSDRLPAADCRRLHPGRRGGLRGHPGQAVQHGPVLGDNHGDHGRLWRCHPADLGRPACGKPGDAHHDPAACLGIRDCDWRGSSSRSTEASGHAQPLPDHELPAGYRHEPGCPRDPRGAGDSRRQRGAAR